MKKDYMKAMKDDIRFYKSAATRKEYKAALKECENADDIDRLRRHYWSDDMYHVIYRDGSELVFTADEVVSGEVTPKVSNVVYIHHVDACGEIDTETGGLDGFFGDLDTDEGEAARTKYFDDIEIRFGTTWGKLQAPSEPETEEEGDEEMTKTDLAKKLVAEANGLVDEEVKNPETEADLLAYEAEQAAQQEQQEQVSMAAVLASCDALWHQVTKIDGKPQGSAFVFDKCMRAFDRKDPADAVKFNVLINVPVMKNGEATIYRDGRLELRAI